jgi:hypothetical protein
LLLAAAALLLLDVSVTFHNLWPTPLVSWKGELSIELALLMLLLAALTRRRSVSRTSIRWVSVGWIVLVVGRYVDVTAPALWGRDLNFYWDLRFLPDVFAMLAGAGRWWLGPLVAVTAAAFFVLLYFVLRWAVGALARAVAQGVGRTAIVGIATFAVALFACDRADVLHVPGVSFARPAAALYAEQSVLVVNGLRYSRELPDSPSFAAGLEQVEGADVLLFFIESYGVVAFERPEFAAALAPSRQLLAQSIAESGHEVVSALVESPTFGGSSWFAHITLLSGVRIGDPDANAQLLRQQRATLPSAFARHGYRTLAVMPGMWSPWVEGSFYGFSDIYNAPRLDYHGPPFGWWDLTDQFAYAKLDALEIDKPNRPPVFVFLPTVSTHTPFTPTPPYQPDWSRMAGTAPYDLAALDRAYAQEIDWTDLGPAYVRALAYSYETLAGYLGQHRGDDLVLILIGDHQPPALVTGEGAPWDVPVHVITNRRGILDRLQAAGFRPGLTPSRPSLGPMHELTPTLLRAFGSYPAP